MAARLFDAFLAKHRSVTCFDDPALNAAAARHPNINVFCNAAESNFNVPPKVGITAWWQLQHQHGYAPLVTRCIVEKNHENVPAQ